MTRTWIDAVLQATAGETVVRAVVVACEGSCPREVGAAMMVWPDRTEGTIGGGSLEHDAIAAGRALLAAPEGPWLREMRSYHLGPDLNQCCGGAVRVLLERFGPSDRGTLERLSAASVPSGRPPFAVTRTVASGLAMQGASCAGQSALVTKPDGSILFEEMLSEARTPLLIYGAGHVARALVRVLDGLPFDVTWIDIAEDRFPASMPPGAVMIAAAEPDRVVAKAGPATFHLVMTHSHTLDEAIVAAVLRRGPFGYLGMIGSATKAARFRQRLGRQGFGPELVGRMASPIGIQGLEGKAPATIAVSVAADLLLRRSRLIGG